MRPTVTVGQQLKQTSFMSVCVCVYLCVWVCVKGNLQAAVATQANQTQFKWKTQSQKVEQSVDRQLTARHSGAKSINAARAGKL